MGSGMSSRLDRAERVSRRLLQLSSPKAAGLALPEARGFRDRRRAYDSANMRHKFSLRYATIIREYSLALIGNDRVFLDEELLDVFVCDRNSRHLGGTVKL